MYEHGGIVTKDMCTNHAKVGCVYPAQIKVSQKDGGVGVVHYGITQDEEIRGLRYSTVIINMDGMFPLSGTF